jgi:hypothetical protein
MSSFFKMCLEAGYNCNPFILTLLVICMATVFYFMVRSDDNEKENKEKP